MAAYDFVEIPLIEVFFITQNLDITFLPETFLDSSMGINNKRVNVNGYSLLKDVSLSPSK